MPDPAPRAIRVFVSSTFRDFVAERDRLARFAFPAIRRACEERAVVFTDVDLRWGITDEQAAEGEVLPICLAEIEASRPFFIGILGERYGWVPDTIPEALIERERWLEEHLTRSVTELEIMHGVLNVNDPEMAARAVFYFRDPAYLDDVAPERRVDFEPEDETAAARLADLKRRIADSPFPVRMYRSVDELDSLVRSDLESAIDALFPADEIPDALTAERMLHDAFMAELTAGFVARPSLGRALDAAADGDGPPLLVTGEPGFGKSALLADFASRYGVNHPDGIVVTHFCGATGGSADWVALCRRVAAELALGTGVETELPDDPEELRGAFKSYLYRAAVTKPFVLVLDGVDQLADDGSALDLGWLPPKMPEGARLILSAASGTHPAVEAVRRNWQALEVGPLTLDERQEVLTSLLARRRKSLPDTILDRICERAAASSPLFLSALVDELSIVGVHNRLEKLLSSYLAVEEPDDIFELIFARWESDYDVVAGLTRETLSALWAARRGLTESELLGILGGDGDPLPQAHLAPLLLAAGRQLVSRSGLLTFAHASTRRAVEDRYLGTEESRRQAHLAAADWFETRCHDARRRLEELPWQWMKAQRWDQLRGLLTDLQTLQAIAADGLVDANTYWAALELEGIRCSDAYRDLPLGRAASIVVTLLKDQGHRKEALALVEKLVAERDGRGKPIPEQLLIDLANLRLSAGEIDSVIGLMKGVARDTAQTASPRIRAAIHGTLGSAYQKQGDSQRALEEFQSAESISRSAGLPAMAARALNNLSWAHWRQQNPAEALRCLTEAMALYLDCGELHGVALCEMAMGRIKTVTLRQHLAANEHYARAQVILEQLGDRHSLMTLAGYLDEAAEFGGSNADQAQQALQGFAATCRKLDFTEGLSFALERLAHGVPSSARTMLLHEWEESCRREHYTPGLMLVLKERTSDALCADELEAVGHLLREWATLAADNEFRPSGLTPFTTLAIPTGRRRTGSFCKDALSIELHSMAEPTPTLFRLMVADACRASDDLDGWTSATMMASLLCAQSDTARDIASAHEQAAEELQHRYGAIWARYRLASIDYDEGRLTEADNGFRQAERLCLEYGDPKGADEIAGSRVSIHRVLGQWEAVLEFKEGLATRQREAGPSLDLAYTLTDIAQICERKLDPPCPARAIVALEEAESLFRSLCERDDARSRAHERAQILASIGRLDDSLAILRLDEHDCRTRGLPRDLAEVLYVMADVIGMEQGLARVVEMLQEYDSIAVQLDADYMLFGAHKLRARIAGHHGQPDLAFAHLEAAVRLCESTGWQGGLPDAHRTKAEIARNAGDLPAELNARQAEEGAIRSLHDAVNADLIACLTAQALALRRLGRLDEAARMTEAAATAIDQLGWPDYAIREMRDALERSRPDSDERWQSP